MSFPSCEGSLPHSTAPVPGELLLSGQSGTRGAKGLCPPSLTSALRLGLPQCAVSTDCCWSSGKRVLLTLHLARRKGAPPRVCHQETSCSVGVRRRSAGLSAPLKSEPRCHSPASLIAAEEQEEVLLVLPVLSYFACHNDADHVTSVVMILYHSLPRLKPPSLRNADIPVCIRNPVGAPRSILPPRDLLLSF